MGGLVGAGMLCEFCTTKRGFGGGDELRGSRGGKISQMKINHSHKLYRPSTYDEKKILITLLRAHQWANHKKRQSVVK